jgi:anti-sigma regulatory factor (Ser/Thr protein kinase)
LETLWDWQLGPLADDVTLCVSELITNAVMHGQRGGELEPASLGLRYFPTACLFVEVADTSEAPPVIRRVADGHEAPSELGLDGRGLLLVKRLSDHLWWRRLPGGGKAVYARLDTPRYFAPLGGRCG